MEKEIAELRDGLLSMLRKEDSEVLSAFAEEVRDAETRSA